MPNGVDVPAADPNGFDVAVVDPKGFAVVAPKGVLAGADGCVDPKDPKPPVAEVEGAAPNGFAAPPKAVALEVVEGAPKALDPVPNGFTEGCAGAAAAF